MGDYGFTHRRKASLSGGCSSTARTRSICRHSYLHSSLLAASRSTSARMWVCIRSQCGRQRARDPGGASSSPAEPNPGVLARLQSNLALNGAGEVVVYPVALLDREEAVELFVPGPQESNQGAATLGEGFPDVASPFRLDVAGTTLDLLLEREGIAGVDLIKVDVEGFEELVLAGSEKTLKRDHPNLVFEYSQEIWELSGHSLSRVLAMLRELGYGGVFHLGRRGSRALPNPPPSFTNIVVPRDGRMPRLTRSLR